MLSHQDVSSIRHSGAGERLAPEAVHGISLNKPYTFEEYSHSFSQLKRAASYRTGDLPIGFRIFFSSLYGH